MASIQCKKCKTGIHYHGEPTGVEHIVIHNEDWKRINNSSFDPYNKIIDEATRYPKLFRTDTINEDFPGVITKFWKCPECGALIFFDSKGVVTEVYVPDDECDLITETPKQEGILFSDYQWDQLTERSIPNARIAENDITPDRIWFVDSGLVLIDSSFRQNFYKTM